jgi:hypothetical protein
MSGKTNGWKTILNTPDRLKKRLVEEGRAHSALMVDGDAAVA